MFLAQIIRKILDEARFESTQEFDKPMEGVDDERMIKKKEMMIKKREEILEKERLLKIQYYLQMLQDEKQVPKAIKRVMGDEDD